MSSSTIQGITVPAGQTWCFDPNVSTTITSTANVIVQGVLRMRPAHAGVVHTLRFTGFNETQYIGGGNDPLPSDVGLWVTGAGSLDVLGAARTGWGRATASLATGARSLTLDRDPIGWRAGDEVMVAATERPDVSGFDQHFEVRTIASVSARTVTLTAGLTWPHPAVTVAAGRTLGAEVANLTRNVRIEGQDATRRAHVFLRPSTAQTIRFAAIRYMGPRKPNANGVPVQVLGRYGLHFHHAIDGSRGSLVEGVVVRDTGAHAFVPHHSHGITFRDTVAYNTQNDVYWYDGETGESEFQAPEPANAPSDTLYDHTLAALMTVPQGDPDQQRATGYWLGAGVRNTVRDSAAVGMGGTGKNPSGYQWPEDRQSLWGFTDNVAHNNRRDGIFVWQNSQEVDHIITRYIAYHNGSFGINQGAYVNHYLYEDSILYANGRANISLWAESDGSPFPRMTFARMVLNGAGYTPYGFLLQRPQPGIGVAGLPAIVCASMVTGHGSANYFVGYTGEDASVAARVSVLPAC